MASLKEVSICFCECSGKILMLNRSLTKSEGGKWTAPSGKCEVGEAPIDTARRELFEETGIEAKSERLISKGVLIQKNENLSVRLHLFMISLRSFPNDILLSSKEHTSYLWVTPQEALALPLMLGASDCIRKVFAEENVCQLD